MLTASLLLVAACGSSDDTAALERRIAQLESELAAARSTTTLPTTTSTQTDESGREGDLTDAEQVWCANTSNSLPVARAIVTLSLADSESYRNALDALEDARSQAAGEGGSALDLTRLDWEISRIVNVMLVGGSYEAQDGADPFTIAPSYSYRTRHSDDFARACRAATESSLG